MTRPRPHDLIWINEPEALEIAPVGWLTACWHPGLPLVVRRDQDPAGRLPVGVRGSVRSQRAAGWVRPEAVVRRLTPEALIALLPAAPAALTAQAPLRAVQQLARRVWPWKWGVTGSTGYALATGLAVFNDASDLDLIVRAPEPIARDDLTVWCEALCQLPCRADTQIETPQGAFAANEWLRGGTVVLVKTNLGPRLMANPWQQGVYL